MTLKKKANNSNNYNQDFRRNFIDQLVIELCKQTSRKAMGVIWKKALNTLNKLNYSDGSKSSYVSEIRKLCKEKQDKKGSKHANRVLKNIQSTVVLGLKTRDKIRSKNEKQLIKRQNANRKIVESVSTIVNDLNASILDGSNRFKYEIYTYIVALCTGRRTDEIFKSGEHFKTISENKILFTGQSKKGSKEIESYTIPILFLPSETIIKYIKIIHQLKPIPKGKRVNTLVSPHLNRNLKPIFKGKIHQSDRKNKDVDVSDTVSMHSLRGIYAMYYIEHIADKKERATRLVLQDLLGHDNDNIGHCYEDYYPKK